MDKSIFNKQLERLVNEYKDKGFTMTKERSLQWYDFMKDIPEKTFEKIISECLKNINYCPTMADVFKFNEKECKRSAYKEVD